MRLRGFNVGDRSVDGITSDRAAGDVEPTKEEGSPGSLSRNPIHGKVVESVTL